MSGATPLPAPRPRRTIGGIAAAVGRRVAARAQRAAIGPASRNGFLASLYFAFLSNRFRREHRAVLAARRAYLGRALGEGSSFGGFRRNVHRLEKALVMRPRRPTFAEGYIAETVAQFVRAVAPDSRIDAGERKWAADVLAAYFDVVTDTPVIAAARARFVAAEHRGDPALPPSVPYAKHTVPAHGIAFADLRRLFVERRSVRWFEDRAVPVVLIEQAVEAASWAPTACNRLPYRFHAVFGTDAAARVARLAGGTAGFSHNIPCLLVVVGDLSNYVEERDRHLIYIDGSLAAMQLMLALQTLGLSSVPINWPDVEEREVAMAAALGLADYERPVMLIGVGYGLADGLIPYSQKKPVSVLLRIEE